MSAPVIGYRREPLGATSDHSSDEGDGWGSDFEGEDEDGCSVDYEEDGEDIYDTPENMISSNSGAPSSGQFHADEHADEDEEGEGLYDVPEFAPEANSEPNFTKQAPPPVFRAKKPDRRPSSESVQSSVAPGGPEQSGNFEEDYLAPGELAPPLKPKPKPKHGSRLPFQNGVGESTSTQDHGEEQESEYLVAGAPFIPAKPTAMRNAPVGSDALRNGSGTRDLRPNLPMRDESGTRPQPEIKPKPGRRPQPLQRPAEGKPSSFPANKDNENSNNPTISRAGNGGSFQSRSEEPLPLVGPKPQKFINSNSLKGSPLPSAGIGKNSRFSEKSRSMDDATQLRKAPPKPFGKPLGNSRRTEPQGQPDHQESDDMYVVATGESQPQSGPEISDEMYEVATGQPNFQSNTSHSRREVPIPGEKPYPTNKGNRSASLSGEPEVTDEMYVIATDDSKFSNSAIVSKKPMIPSPRHMPKQSGCISTPGPSPVTCDDLYEVATDSDAPKIDSRSFKRPPPIPGGKPSRGLPSPQIDSNAEFYEVASDSAPPVGAKPGKTPTGASRSPRGSEKGMRLPLSEPPSVVNEELYEVADQSTSPISPSSVSQGPARAARPQLPLPSKDTSDPQPEERKSPRTSRFPLFKKSSSKSAIKLPSPTSKPEQSPAINPRVPQRPPKKPLGAKPGSKTDVLNNNVNETTLQENYEPMNSDNKPVVEENYNLGSFCTAPVQEPRKPVKPPPQTSKPKRPSISSNSSVEQDMYEVAGDNNTQSFKKRTNEPVVQETYEVLSDGQVTADSEPEMYEVPDGPSPKRISPPRTALRQGLFSESSIDSEEDYIEPISDPHEKAPAPSPRDKGPPPLSPRDPKPNEIKREDSGGSGKNTGLKQKLRSPGDGGVVHMLQKQIASFLISKDVQSQKFSNGSGKKLPSEKPAIPARSDPVREEREPILSLEDLQALNRPSPGPPKPKIPSRPGAGPPKPERTLSKSESMVEIMNNSEWYHGGLPRAEAEKKLTRHRKDGMFIVRDTEKGHGYSMSFYESGAVRHLRINHHLDANNYNLGSYVQRFGSVVELIKYFQENAFEVKKRESTDSRGGLAKLTVACPR